MMNSTDQQQYIPPHQQEPQQPINSGVEKNEPSAVPITYYNPNEPSTTMNEVYNPNSQIQQPMINYQNNINQPYPPMTHQQTYSPYPPQVYSTTGQPQAFPQQTTPQAYYNPNMNQQPQPNLYDNNRFRVPPPNRNAMKPEIPNTTFQNLLKSKTSTLHEYSLQNQDSMFKYLCCASLGFFKWCSIVNQVSHITILPPGHDFNPTQPCNEIGTKSIYNQQFIRRSDNCCYLDCCLSCASCCHCGGGCSGGSSSNCGNCYMGDCVGGSGSGGEGVVYVVVIIFLILLLSLVFLLGLYIVTAPIAIFLTVYHEKITTIQFNDEKREITMISRAKYFREYFIFGTLNIPYMDIHNIYCQLIANDDYCLVIQLRNGNRVNISKPLQLNYTDIKSGEKFLKEFLKERNLSFEMKPLQQSQELTSTCSTQPLVHQMV